MGLKVGCSYECKNYGVVFDIIGVIGSIFVGFDHDTYTGRDFCSNGKEWDPDNYEDIYELDLDTECDALLEIKPRASAQPTDHRRNNMAKVTVQISGGEAKVIEANTVEEAKQKVNALGYTATVNGEPESDDYRLDDYEFVALAKPVKAG